MSACLGRALAPALEPWDEGRGEVFGRLTRRVGGEPDTDRNDPIRKGTIVCG
jgi:hypothetical protein